MIRVQEEDFDAGAEIAALTRGNRSIGGISVFIGVVREMLDAGGVESQALTLEHYPGMTEKMLEEIEREARRRWRLEESLVVHRVGRLKLGEQIVLVVTASAHRGDAVEACHFLIDWLKTKAPFWKHEETPQGPRWVSARESDEDAARKWVRGKAAE